MKAPSIRIIWVTPRFPLGTPDGARHATRALLNHLTELHMGIDLICLVPTGEPVDSAAAMKQMNLLSCSAIYRSRSLLNRLPGFKTPFTFKSFAASNVREALKQRIDFLLQSADATRNTWILFDGLHTFASLGEADIQAFSERCRGIVYRAHNVETTFWEQCEARARTPWFRWFFRFQADLVRTFERRVSQCVNLIAPVSEEDAAKFKHLAPEATMAVTPIGMDFPDEKSLPPILESARLELLFIGRLDWLPNRNGLVWFLEKVWPLLMVRKTALSLKIAGIGNGGWLQRYRHLAGVQFLGKVEDIEPLYNACAITLAPLFQGSGTRVKIIEAARYGRAVISTALGVEGTGLVAGESYVKAVSEHDWVAALETITTEDCRKMGFMAYQSLRERFDGRVVAERFRQVLEAHSITLARVGSMS